MVKYIDKELVHLCQRNQVEYETNIMFMKLFLLVMLHPQVQLAN